MGHRKEPLPAAPDVVIGPWPGSSRIRQNGQASGGDRYIMDYRSGVSGGTGDQVHGLDEEAREPSTLALFFIYLFWSFIGTVAFGLFLGWYETITL